MPLLEEDPRRLDLVSLAGDVLDVAPDLRQYIIRSGVTGLQVPPREVIRDREPGMDGARLVRISTLEREVVLPWYVEGDGWSRATSADLVAAMRDLLNYRTAPYGDEDGTCDLRATDVDGSARYLRVTYLDGMEGAEGHTAGGGGQWWTFDTRLLAVDPYWRGPEWSTPVVRVASTAPFLSSSASYPWPRTFAASSALGSAMSVTVPGDVPSPPVVTIEGPATSVTITSTTGLSIQVGAVPAGSTFVLDTGRHRRADLDGVPRWDLVGAYPRWAPVSPGTASMTIALAGATTASSARVSGVSLWETAW